MRALAVPLAAALLVGSCGGGGGPTSIDDGPPDAFLGERPPERLSAMRLLEWDRDAQTFRYNERVVPYDLNTPLFSDFALKARAIYVPEGQTITYDPATPFAFPVGTVIVKTFYFPADFRAPDAELRLIETRILRHTDDGWEAWPYVWNEEQTDAFLEVGGESRAITFVDPEGATQTANYLIPQKNQCSSCHARNVGEGMREVLTPIGPAARHLNREFPYPDGPAHQLQHLADLGMLSGLPALSEVPASYDARSVASAADIPAEDVARAARDYLDINCAHCHDPLGPQGVTSQLFLNHDNEDLFRLGVCKRPGSAGEGTGGLTYDIVPGDPDQSILVYRVETTEVGAMMPLLGRSLRDPYGATLVRRWIAGMEPMSCE